MAEDNKENKNDKTNEVPAATPPPSPVPSTPSSEGEVGSLEQPAGTVPEGVKPDKPTKVKKPSLIKRLTSGSNLYLIAFAVIVLLAVFVTFIAFKQDGDGTTIKVSGNELTDEVINDLTANETKVGDVTQTLTVEANAIFNGKILVKDNLDVAGSINVGGPLTLPGITVSGSSTFDDVEVGNNLSILGNSSVQGTLSVQNGLSVTGDGTFTGRVSADSISASTIELLGDLQITRHIDSGGASPKISSSGSLGSGGTSSISGTDTAGTITLNTGGSPNTGILATITFNKSFTSTPHVVVSAVSVDAASLDVYVIRTSTGFTIRAASVPADSTTYIFDYIVIE